LRASFHFEAWRQKRQTQKRGLFKDLFKMSGRRAGFAAALKYIFLGGNWNVDH
jgi:hypothetical protein